MSRSRRVRNRTDREWVEWRQFALQFSAYDPDRSQTVPHVPWWLNRRVYDKVTIPFCNYLVPHFTTGRLFFVCLKSLPAWVPHDKAHRELVQLLLDLPSLAHLSSDSLEIIVDYMLPEPEYLEKLLFFTGTLFDRKHAKGLSEPLRRCIRHYASDEEEAKSHGLVLGYPQGKMKRLIPYVLEHIVTKCFHKHQRYTESAVNSKVLSQFVCLRGIDISTLRRQIVELRLLVRSPDCEWYWRPKLVHAVRNNWTYF